MSYDKSLKRIFDLVEAGRKDEATAWILTQVRKDQRQYFQAVRALIQHQNDSLIESAHLAEQEYRSTLAWLLDLAALAFALGIAVAVGITRSITAPLRQAVGIASTVATGDLGQVIEIRTSDETGLLLRALPRFGQKHQ
jgi:methyl-accepting chemotaxis protein